MGCYIETFPDVPSLIEYDLWKEQGFTGDYENYLLRQREFSLKGQKFFICGKLGPHCADCFGVGDFLCDYPVGNDKTCDRAMCQKHAHEIAPEIHYCDAHYKEWVEFRDSGGVSEILKNIIAFKREK